VSNLLLTYSRYWSIGSRLIFFRHLASYLCSIFSREVSHSENLFDCRRQLGFSYSRNWVNESVWCYSYSHDNNRICAGFSGRRCFHWDWNCGPLIERLMCYSRAVFRCCGDASISFSYQRINDVANQQVISFVFISLLKVCCCCQGSHGTLFSGVGFK